MCSPPGVRQHKSAFREVRVVAYFDSFDKKIETNWHVAKMCHNTRDDFERIHPTLQKCLLVLFVIC